MATPDILVHPDATTLACAAAQDLADAIAAAQRRYGSASIVVTGGSTGIAVLEQLREHEGLDWSRLDLFWGDERFLPTGHPDRNDTQADEAMIAHVPLAAARIHRMPASEGKLADDPEQAARTYEEHLHHLGNGKLPRFDVHLLGMGPDGHINSLFPHDPALGQQDRHVVGVTASPKPPAQRITLTLPAVQHSTEVWLLVSGAAKAPAVAAALRGAPAGECPAAAANGVLRTAWYLDRDAASELP
ncbi:6-phosphogluconolactonase [Hoyosella sp. G463]|uniref:6-phosphogluconolactonase n=1 Tax=Lolliginicoccus lacisalsi TaxID=2742202 RepID=A0A927PLD1_9ACTN|nr:6-phosphogluconolactonase [Lolliginicoccus lacisalsi]MBD8505252.1 6-phosphogluconolactonase [Lolliginicoccus lacisalsi]